MATLNAQANGPYEDDEDDETSGASRAPKELTWHWRTWPNNLRRSVAISTGVLVAIVALFLFLQEQDKDFTQKLNTNTGGKSQAQTKLRESGQERDTIVKHLPVLRELEARGIFGEEKRLEWVEQLRIIEKRWPGIAIKYDISPQKLVPKEGATGVITPIPPGAKLPNGDPVKQFGVFSTDMKLTLQLLHEGDALAIFDELKAANLGLFSVKKCTLRRPDNGAPRDIPGDFGAPLTVDCVLNWISMSTYSS
jgi:hypothetical protein